MCCVSVGVEIVKDVGQYVVAPAGQVEEVMSACGGLFAKPAE